MAISSVGPSVNATQTSTAAQTPPSTPAAQPPSSTPATQPSEKAEGGVASQSASTPAPTVLTQSSSGTHHHKKKPVHPLPGQPGYQINKTA
jgi:hypothetical protein